VGDTSTGASPRAHRAPAGPRRCKHARKRRRRRLCSRRTSFSTRSSTRSSSSATVSPDSVANLGSSRSVSASSFKARHTSSASSDSSGSCTGRENGASPAAPPRAARPRPSSGASTRRVAMQAPGWVHTGQGATHGSVRGPTNIDQPHPPPLTVPHKHHTHCRQGNTANLTTKVRGRGRGLNTRRHNAQSLVQ
jgi:hypothetical protein